MAIDRHEDDSPAAAAGADKIAPGGNEPDGHVVDGTGAEKSVTDEIPAADGGHASRHACDESPDLDCLIVDGEDRVPYHLRYREVVEAVNRAAAHDRWDAAKPGLETEWREYARRHPTPADSSPALDETVATKVKEGCDRIGETEENIVTPAMRRIEAADPERYLVGLEHRRKGQDRIMEKVAGALEEQPDLTPEEALTSVKDAIRYTFLYAEERYSEGVRADVDALKAEGYELVDIRNSWASEEYKGINSRWRFPENNQLFEVQFHTGISFEAKQLTHEAYERIRRPSSTKSEQDELARFQRRVNSFIPSPPHVLDIPDYP